MARRSGLGKGLSSLIPPGETEPGESNAGGFLREIPVGDITPNPNQPRVHFDEESLAELTASIQQLGVLQPILVRPVGSGFELIAGERRWRAAGRAGLAMIPAVVRDTDDLASIEQALVENLHRQDLTALEEAAAYQQLIEDFELTHERARGPRRQEPVGDHQHPPPARVCHRRSSISSPTGSSAPGHARALLGDSGSHPAGGTGPSRRRRGVERSCGRRGGQGRRRVRRVRRRIAGVGRSARTRRRGCGADHSAASTRAARTRGAPRRTSRDDAWRCRWARSEVGSRSTSPISRISNASIAGWPTESCRPVHQRFLRCTSTGSRRTAL